MPLFILQALENQDIEIFGDGTQKVDLIHTRDFSQTAIDFVFYKGNVEFASFHFLHYFGARFVSFAVC